MLTPRELWHECDHHHDIENSNETHFENGDCFACDFGLGFIDQPIVFTYHYFKTSYAQFDVSLSSFYLNKGFDHFSHRGPPII